MGNRCAIRTLDSVTRSTLAAWVSHVPLPGIVGRLPAPHPCYRNCVQLTCASPPVRASTRPMERGSCHITFFINTKRLRRNTFLVIKVWAVWNGCGVRGRK